MCKLSWAKMKDCSGNLSLYCGLLHNIFSGVFPLLHNFTFMNIWINELRIQYPLTLQWLHSRQTKVNSQFFLLWRRIGQEYWFLSSRVIWLFDYHWLGFYKFGFNIPGHKDLELGIPSLKGVINFLQRESSEEVTSEREFDDGKERRVEFLRGIQ